MKQILAILFFISITFLACKETPTGTAEIGKKDYTWAKRTSFKVSFDDEYEKYETIKRFNNRGLMKDLLEGVEKGEIPAYGYEDNKRLTDKQVKQIFFPTDTAAVVDPITFEETQKVVENELDWNDVRKFRVKQDWYYDKVNNKMDAKIIAVAPTRQVNDDQGNYRGDFPLFWIYFDGKPE